MQLSTRLRARPVKNVSDKGNASQFRRFWSVLVPELTVKVCYSDHHLAFHREFKHVLVTISITLVCHKVKPMDGKFMVKPMLMTSTVFR